MQQGFARLWRRPRQGQSLVEFALVAPLLVALVVGIFELGIVFSVYIGLTNSVREVARVGAVYRYPGPPIQTGALTNQAQINTAVAPIDNGRLISMTDALTPTLNPIIQTANLSPIQVAYPELPTAANLARSGQPISLTLSYTHTLLFGVLGDRELVLRAQSSARIEPGGN
ncbi:MAG: TadE/TadG family type IV pilus assembly protein [Oscillochloridaceae bacterium umkhey_bin13]